MHKLSDVLKTNKNAVLICIAVLGIIITGGLILANSNHGFTMPTLFGISDSQIAKNAVAYINNNKLASTPATLVSFSEASGLVKVKIQIGTSSFDSYVTKDGKLLFPQAFDMSAVKTTTAAAASGSAASASNTTASATPTVVTKSSKPLLEAFVVSSCPFGLQMQRAIVEAVKENPSLASEVAIKYIGSVSGTTLSSMHGPEEGAENLRQICIRDEQPAKFYSYLACYMQKTTATAASGMPLGDSPSCQASTGIDTTKLNACVSDPTRGLAYAQKDFNEDTKYNVSGSPTLILNGASIDESGYGGRSADGVRAMVCAGYTSQPSFCTTKLNTTEATTSFAVSYAASGAAATASSGANCGAVAN